MCALVQTPGSTLAFMLCCPGSASTTPVNSVSPGSPLTVLTLCRPLGHPCLMAGCVLREMLVPSLPQPHFPAADQRLPALADPPPVGLEPLFQACVQQQALDRPNARVVWQRLSHMQVA